MKIYQTEKGVAEYIRMSEGYDLSLYKEQFLKFLKEGSTLLELGMGPGNDYHWLSELYQVTGSDYSQLFLDKAKIRFPDGDFILLDAVSIKTNKRFDCIFSNKVYQYFDIYQIEKALIRQLQLLTGQGIIIHTLWIGDQVFEDDDYKAVYHNEAHLKEIVSKHYKILEWLTYSEFEDNDSVFFVARRS
jgi:ubiquinone/menaquinone biosynthesis C-methylase UbiE